MWFFLLPFVLAPEDSVKELKFKNRHEHFENQIYLVLDASLLSKWQSQKSVKKGCSDISGQNLVALQILSQHLNHVFVHIVLNKVVLFILKAVHHESLQ